MKKISWCVAFITAIVFFCSAFAATAPGSSDHQQRKNMSMGTLNTNAWRISTTNYGPFVKSAAGGSGGFWHGDSHGYIYGSGLWIGATDAQGNKVVAVGYNPNSGQSEFGPVSMDDTYENYLSDPKARIYLSTNLDDVAEWPLYDSAGHKVIKSRQDSYCKYSDENPAFTSAGDSILNVKIEQFSYAWNYPVNYDIVFFKFKITNRSGNILDSV
jgi:hypothetical protein